MACRGFLALREFLGLVLAETPPDHSTISRTRRLIDRRPVERVSPIERHATAEPAVVHICVREMVFTTGC